MESSSYIHGLLVDTYVVSLMRKALPLPLGASRATSQSILTCSYKAPGWSFRPNSSLLRTALKDPYYGVFSGSPAWATFEPLFGDP